MKVIVFGGAGFLGSHVADALTEKGYDVTIFDLVKSPFLKENQKSIIGDILDENKVKKAVSGCDCVYNFAGIADIDDAKINPVETIKNNVLGNTIILDACRKEKAKRYVFASTIYVYSESGSFYRSSKQACELIIENYQKEYGLDFSILRYGSLYGPRANETNWMYSMLRQALLEKKIVREGDGEEIREYIHVFDAARLSVNILKEEFKNQYVIIAGNQQTRIKDLLMMVKEILNNQVSIEFVKASYDEHYEITPYTFNPRLAKRIVSDQYVDMGQGILDILNTIHKDAHNRKNLHE